MPELTGFSHVELTVSDSERAAVWWQDVMGFAVVHHFRGESFEGRAMVHPSGVGVSVMTHDGTAETGAFDERRVGLDHLAFRVADRDELQRWVMHLEAKDVAHSEIIDAEFGPTVVCRDPDNVQLEFFVHSNTDELMHLNAADSAGRGAYWRLSGSGSAAKPRTSRFTEPGVFLATCGCRCGKPSVYQHLACERDGPDSFGLAPHRVRFLLYVAMCLVRLASALLFSALLFSVLPPRCPAAGEELVLPRPMSAGRQRPTARWRDRLRWRGRREPGPACRRLWG
ncbi:MAG: lactoylglutathione lyase-like lyase [Mycobacterium sp.]|jgi:glyoxylase I family protein|nr:lactoylglutathione lyase-like lyase [Mycobacterium sp.]